ncbi:MULTISPECIES: hypothetical protein [Nocardioides]|uniref:Copper chaperone PCu(A)C n=1 Tax=Nocardioides vastitatis TaxID=2568655 RepID=A0ABW0ZE33_9ACTN|nr:hypothetical protein [Nocardioides sp.]THJ06778.1 hypothetical protein E7Z54_05815 [Nocardioides sp.]
MRHLRPTAIAGLLLALPAATLSSCGFDYPTDRVNTIAAGVTDREASVDALGIRVLAWKDGEGRLIGSLANNTQEPASLEAVTSPEGTVEAGRFRPVVVEGRRGVNLAEEKPIPLTGDFAAGDFITLELEFSTGEAIRLDVPVVKPCFQYTQVPTPSTSAATESDEHATDEHATDTQADEHATDTQADEHATEHSAPAYICEHPTEGGGGH